MDPITQLANRRAAEIADKLRCPNCNYRLNGLQGMVVDCPECGRQIDLAVLAVADWERPLHRTPFVASFMRTLHWSIIGALVLPCLMLATLDQPTAGLACLVPFLVPWLGFGIWHIRRQAKAFGWWNLWRLLLVLHGYAFALLGGLLTIVVGGLALMTITVGQLDSAGTAPLPTSEMVGAGFMIVIGVALFVVGRRAEAYVKRACMRVYFARKADMDERP